MRKHAFWAGAALALALVACTREMEVQVLPEAEEVTFSAVWAEESGTRTALQENGTSIWWTPGEEINVFQGTMASGKFTSTNTEPQELVQFRGSMEVMTGTVETPGDQLSYWAVYPYDEANTCDGESVTVTVPSAQVAQEGTFADKFFPAVAKSQNFALAFFNVCGGARFSVENEGIKAVAFRSNAGEPLVGKARVTFGEDGKPVVESITEGSDQVVVTAPEGGFVPGKYYFAAFLPQSFSKGLTMTFWKETGHASYGIKAITVNRSRFGKLDAKDKDLVFDMPVPEKVDLGLSVEWATFNLGANKAEEYGDYYAWGETEPYYVAGDAQAETPVWQGGKDSGYDWASYRWCTDSYAGLTKYCNDADFGKDGFTDGKVDLDLEDDAAFAYLGEKWRIPSRAEQDELRTKCTWEWTELNGVNGYEVTGPSGKSIFLPAAGYRYLVGLLGVGVRGYYSSASLNASGPMYAYDLYFLSGTISRNSIMRNYGLTIRPVFGDRAVPVTGVSLDPSELDVIVGETITLTATISPANATNKAVVWTTSDPSVATVTSDGVVTGFGLGTAVITVTTVDGDKKATCTVTVKPVPRAKPEKVDLGLSVKWGSFNLGAEAPEEFGDYFAWGETEPYYEPGSAQNETALWLPGKEAGYFWSSYQWCEGDGFSLTKYCFDAYYGNDGFSDGQHALLPEDDAAQKEFGDTWRIPTDGEMRELVSKCTWEWTELNGVNGYEVTGPSGKSIFLPAAGYRYLAGYLGNGATGYYATASLHATNPCYAVYTSFTSGNVVGDNNIYRYYGLTVRPVAD
jgi:hypothetical protein